jgi:ABC-2 type transport system ATP-binding protein
MTTYAIKTENLGRDFGTLRAVDDLSIDVPTGSVFGFLGPNGAGKTTTIRLLLGLLEPTQGRAQVVGSMQFARLTRSAPEVVPYSNTMVCMSV